MDDLNSDQDNRDEAIIGKSSSKKTAMKYDHFFEIIKLYPCLFNKSQTPRNKTVKQHALQEIKTKIENIHGISLSGSQIRKKLENMKMRAKAKRDKIQMGDLATRFKYFEEELLKLMDYKNNSLIKFITEPEQCDVSADSSKYFKYEAEDEMSQDEEEHNSRSQITSNVIPGVEIKSETNDSLQLEQIGDLNCKDTDSFISEEDHIDKIVDKTITTKSGFGIKDQDFFDIIKCYGCLFEKSQAPHVKIIKQDALQEIKEKLKSIHGKNLNSSQIRKKIDNMKGRLKGKLDKSKRRNSPKYKFKAHEWQLLNLMKFKKVSDSEIYNVLNSSDDSNEPEEAVFEKEKPQLTSSSFPKCLNSTPRSSENSQFNKFSIFAMQKEVLTEQKELNRQQNELNSLQKEILTLKKEKLLLEIDLLKNKR